MSAAPTSLRRRPLPGVGTAAAAALRVVRHVPLRVWLGVLVALMLLGGGWLWLRDSPLVAVKHVTVIGAHGPDAKAIRTSIEDAAFDQTTLHLDAPALERAVSSYPLVKSLEIHAHPPHGLTVVVESEKPVAWVAGGGQRVAVNATGKVLGGAFSSLSLPTVPVSVEPAGGHVTDRAALEALDAIAEAPVALAARVIRVRLVSGTGLIATLRRGPELRLGDTTRLAAKWDAAARVLADASSHGARYIDVTVPERPAAGGVAGPGQSAAVAPVTPVAPAVSQAVTTPAPVVTTPVATTPQVTTTPVVTTPAATTPIAPTGGATAAGATPSVNP